MPRKPRPGQVLPWPPQDGAPPRPGHALPKARGPLQGEPVERRGEDRPPGKTGAEESFYKKHMMRRTPMVVVTEDGNRHRGWIEWYDRDVIKLHSLVEPNLFIAKDRIRYIYKHAEDPDAHEEVPTPPPLEPSPRRRGTRTPRRRPLRGGPGRLRP